MSNIVIFGATSAIATACARLYAKQGHALFLLARDTDKLLVLENDLLSRGASAVTTLSFIAQDQTKHSAIMDACIKELQTIDIALIAYGSLPNQDECEQNVQQSLDEITLNGLSVVSFVSHLSQQMRQQKNGHIAVISSVAGDRGRPSNFVYGSAKKLVSTYLEGLSVKLQADNVFITDIKPGFVDTPMTDGMDKSGFLWSKPDVIANDIIKAIDNKKSVLYTPFYWRYIMLIIQHIPTFIFKKLSL